MSFLSKLKFVLLLLATTPLLWSIPAQASTLYTKSADTFVASSIKLGTEENDSTYDISLKALTGEDSGQVSLTKKGDVATFQANNVKGVFLDVPYINQCLQRDKKTFFPSNFNKKENKEACRFMCTAASMVMIGGYFNKLPFKHTDELKRNMVSDNGQGITDTCGTNQGGAFGMIAKETDVVTGGKTSCNRGSKEGMRKYAAKIGLFTDFLKNDLASIKSGIDRGNPVVLSSSDHVFLVKGYVGDKLIVNDPYRDGSEKGEDYNYDGRSALYELDKIYYKNELKPIVYVMEVSNKTLTAALNKKGDKVESFAEGDGISTGLSIRTDACSSERLGRVAQGARGVITDEPKVVEACNLGYEFKVWYKIKWDNGKEGWSSGNYVQKI